MDNNDKQFLYKYWGRALASRYLYAWVPYLRYVGLNGSLARGVASKKSDIDLMVVAEPGHIFTVRFLMISTIALVGIKRSQKKIAGRLCVNYFVTGDNLDIKPHNKKVAQWYKYMVPLLDSDSCPNFSPARGETDLVSNKSRGVGVKEIAASITPCNDNRIRSDREESVHDQISNRNQWMKKHRVHISKNQLIFNQEIEPVGEPWVSVRRCIEFALFLVGDALEIFLKYIQIAKIKRHPLTASNLDKIIVSDKELMFHPRKTPESLE